MDVELYTSMNLALFFFKPNVVLAN